MAAAAVIQPVEISQNASVMGGFCTRTSAPLPGSACAFKRAASMSANVRKVFILHDEGENATAARLRTVELAKMLDASEIVTYYRNAPHKVPAQPGDTFRALRMSWNGADRKDLIRSSNFIRSTVHHHKGAYVAMIGLGHSRKVLELVAKEHELEETALDPNVFPNSGDYPVTFMTPTLFTTFYIAQPDPFSENALAAFPSAILPTNTLAKMIKDVISRDQRFYSTPKPSLEELRATKVARKKDLVEDAKRLEEDKRIWSELKARVDNGEDIPLPDRPMTGRKKRQKEKLEKQMLELWGDEEEPNEEYPPHFFNFKPEPDPLKPLLFESPNHFKWNASMSDQISSNVLAPSAEPVTPCSVDLLKEMIDWLEIDQDIVAEQEPRIDFVRGSILGKTTAGGGTSVDLCKQVVGPKGIKPILDAVGKNSHIDRFLLGNNIVGDEGAKVIADFIASEKSKRIYNFYIAGNSISPPGMREIASALSMNTTVTALWLKRNPLLPQGAKYLASALTTNTALQTLDLVNTGILDEGVISVIQALQQNPASSLQHLYIGGNAETAKSGEAIGNWLKTGYSRLTSLFLSCSRLEDEGVKFIAEGLKVDKLINRIGLESVRVGDEGAKALADALEHHPSITLLDLGFRKGTFEMGERPNQITDEGLLYIGEKLIGPPDARKVNNLRILDFVSNKITREGAQKFVETYVRGNEQLLRVRLSQTGAERNISVEHECKQLARENQKKFFEPSLPLSEEEKQERLRVKEVMEPNHISEIYSIYRGNM